MSNVAQTATCTTCGTSFEVPASLQERFPGWTPTKCPACHQGRRAGQQAMSRGGGEGQSLGRRLPLGVRSEAERRVSGVERSETTKFTPSEVLERFTAGPLTGVFTDGSADPNPGPGGWGAVYVREDEIIAEAHGHEPHTTNNRMELTALIVGFDMVPAGESATVYSDSNYCVKMINEWAPVWARNGWRRKAGPVKNLDLVKALYERAQARPELELRWIKAHDGSRWNEYADALSVAYRRD
jgi:ribonuclease HI